MAGRKAEKTRRARGTGSVFFDQSRNVWVGRRPVGRTAKGRTRYVEVSAPTQAACVAKLAQAQPPGPKTTVKEWSARWLESLTVRPTTLDGYTFAVARITAALGHLRLTALTAHQCEEACRAWATAGHEPGTVRNTFQVLRSLLAAAVRAGLIPSNPATGAKKPKAPESKIQIFTPEEMARIVAACDSDPAAHVVAALAGCGLRLGEALGLDVIDYDEDAGTLRVTKTWRHRHGSGPPKSRHSTRTVRVPPPARPAIAAAKGGRTSGPLFISSAAGKRRARTSVYVAWERLLKGLGIVHRNPHQLRHSFASHALAAGYGIGDVARHLGDTPEVIMRTYCHATGADPSVAFDRILTLPATSSMGQA